jgi:hypothetical protein
LFLASVFNFRLWINAFLTAGEQFQGTLSVDRFQDAKFYLHRPARSPGNFRLRDDHCPH